MRVGNAMLSLAVVASIGCEKPGISDAHMSSKADGSDSVSSFSASSPTVYFRVEYTALSEGDALTARLMFGMQEVTAFNGAVPADGDGVMTGSFTNHSPPWPAGAYEMQVSLNGALVKRVPFSIH